MSNSKSMKRPSQLMGVHTAVPQSQPVINSKPATKYGGKQLKDKFTSINRIAKPESLEVLTSYLPHITHHASDNDFSNPAGKATILSKGESGRNKAYFYNVLRSEFRATAERAMFMGSVDSGIVDVHVYQSPRSLFWNWGLLLDSDTTKLMVGERARVLEAVGGLALAPDRLEWGAKDVDYTPHIGMGRFILDLGATESDAREYLKVIEPYVPDTVELQVPTFKMHSVGKYDA
jgi:hypothetical protein